MLDELGERRARHQHALIDVEAQAREPGLVGEIGERHAFGDAAREQRLDTRGLRGRGATSQHPWRRVVRQSHRVEHQGRGLIARIVGAMAEEHARTTQATFHRGDQLAAAVCAVLTVK